METDMYIYIHTHIYVYKYIYEHVLMKMRKGQLVYWLTKTSLPFWRTNDTYDGTQQNATQLIFGELFMQY